MEQTLFNNEPNIMPNQDKAFNGDIIACERFIELKYDFKIETVIELGSAVGGSTRWFCMNFDKVITTEINPIFRDVCLQRIKSFNNVESLLGDTVELLPGILKKCDDNTIIFADDHWLHCPLLDELRIISESGLKPILIVHDFKVPNHLELGFDSYNGQDYEWDWIKDSIENIYDKDNFVVEYNSEATGAKRGIIYLMPKVNN